MWSLLVGRFVNWWKLVVGVLLAAIPVVAYVFGRKDGKAVVEKKVVEDALRTEHDRAEFYKSIGEAADEATNNRPADRDDLVKRVRQHGL